MRASQRQNQRCNTSDLAVFIRAAGERTEAACRKIVQEETRGRSEIHVIRERPLSKSLEVGYEAALAVGSKWSMFLDADILLRTGAMSSLAAAMNKVQPDCGLAQPYFVDKLTISVRDGGAHIYKTYILERALRELRGLNSAIRPESMVKLALIQGGVQLKKIPYIVGVHDYEQSSFDVFRKGYLHGFKHSHLAPQLMAKYRKLAVADEDYTVALAGLCWGVQSRDVPELDHSSSRYRDLWQDTAFREKPPLSDGHLDTAFVDALLERIVAQSQHEMRGLPCSLGHAMNLTGCERIGLIQKYQMLMQRTVEGATNPVQKLRSIVAAGLHVVADKMDPFRRGGANGMWAQKGDDRPR